MVIIPPFVVDALKDLKDFNEVMLARNLYEVFEKNPTLKEAIRKIGYVAVAYVHEISKYVKTHSKIEAEKALLKVLKKEKGLLLWGSPEPVDGNAVRGKIEGLRNGWKGFTTNDCSEALRLFGGVVEEVNAHLKGVTVSIKCDSRTTLKLVLEDLEMLRKAYRSGYGRKVQKDLWKEAQSKAQKKDGTNSAPFRSDVRKRDFARMDKDGDITFGPSYREMKDGETYRPLSASQLRYVIGSSKRESERDVRGMTLWKLKEGSTVWSIDRIFGLPPGADISGTTADLMWGLEIIAAALYPQRITKTKGKLWGYNVKKPAPGPNTYKKEYDLLYLLPIAAMVSHYHHTILECALTQVFNSEIIYSIGFYTTLLSPDCADTPTAQKVREVLKKWEDNPTNFKMVIFDEDDGKWGAIFTDKKEVEGFKDFATMSYERYAKVFEPLREKKKIKLNDIATRLATLNTSKAKALIDKSRQEKKGLATLLKKKS